VEVAPGDTIAVLKQRVIDKFDDPKPISISLKYIAKDLRDEFTVADYNLQNNNTLFGQEVFGDPDLIRPRVVAELQNTLRTLATDLTEGTFIFISIGCYDHKHGVASIKRQQCPDRVINWCRQNAWNLIVVLIDQDFRQNKEDEPQIYNVGEQGWSSVPKLTMLEERVRVYRNLTATFLDPSSAENAQHDMRIVVFAAGIPEYGDALMERRRIAGESHMDTFQLAIQEGNLRHCCVVSGNFYPEELVENHYCAIGDGEALAACRIEPNP
jgi:hypothetical protein